MTDELCKDFARAVKTLFPDIRDWNGITSDVIFSTKRARHGEEDLVLVFATGREARLLMQYLRACQSWAARAIPENINGPVTLDRRHEISGAVRAAIPAGSETTK